MTVTTSPALTSGDVDVDLRADGARIRPRGPFSLARAHRSVSRWGPLSRHAGAGGGTGDGPVRVAVVGDGDHVPFAAALTGSPDGVDVHLTGIGPDRVPDAVAQVARMFSLDHDATGLAVLARREPAVGAVLDANPGLRPVLFGSPYEAACWAVISPRIGKAGAAALQRRLAEAHGTPLTVAGGPVTAFPTPEALRRVEEFPGLPEEKVRRLQGVADAALHGDLDVERLRALGLDDARAALREIRGVGPFWASGIWLRACGVVDEWPEEPTCSAILAALHGRDPAAGVGDLIETLAPYRMWVEFALRMSA